MSIRATTPYFSANTSIAAAAAFLFGERQTSARSAFIEG
jgi:hypothetical protein